MAVMIPEKPNVFHESSLENVMFDALEKLPEEYYVFHSFRITKVISHTIHESETDFIIFHPQKGILCLEAKAGSVSYKDGHWLYGNGQSMHNGGPFNQAAANKWKLMQYIAESSVGYINERLKYIHGVWFPSLTSDKLDNIQMPPEGDRSLVIGMEAIENPQPYIEMLFSLNVQTKVTTDLTPAEVHKLLRGVLCPKFNIFPPSDFDIEVKHMLFHRMLDEQSAILNFLDEQRTAVINGAAGTGKTLIAVEKARRHAENGENVLFLCFNVALKNHLEEKYGNHKISFMTIAAFSCQLCDTDEPDYRRTVEKLKDYVAFGGFPYEHVIIDEGQDFGREVIEETQVLKLLHKIIVSGMNENSSFYVFYDRFQLVQAEKIPEFISDCDCRLTLHNNCRNTKNIFKTSIELLPITVKKLAESGITGKIPKMHYVTCSSVYMNVLDEIISKLHENKIQDIVILTLKTEKNSILANDIVNQRYKGCYFTSCRKFKGLEADAVILVDFSESTLLEEVQLFYVGASRARIQLEIVTDMNNEACKYGLEKLDKRVSKRPMRDLATVINTMASIH